MFVCLFVLTPDPSLWPQCLVIAFPRMSLLEEGPHFASWVSQLTLVTYCRILYFIDNTEEALDDCLMNERERDGALSINGSKAGSPLSRSLYLSLGFMKVTFTE